ncbi:MAG: heme oxygenase (biliverdin-producing) [Synoicihabitans sp.]
MIKSQLMHTLSTPQIPFSQRLRESTRKAHSMAERAGFIRGFLRGVIDPQNYRQLLTDYYHVYDAMETVMSQSTHPIVSAIYFPELRRLPAIGRDLEYFAGPNWEMGLNPSKSAIAYAAQIHAIAKSDPELLVAHAYTRYLGDLSGGQILKKILVSALNLPDNQGSNFYEFPEISDHAKFKKTFRRTLDELPLAEFERVAIIEEANAVFAHNTAIFNELDGSAWDSVISMLSHAFATPLRAA